MSSIVAAKLITVVRESRYGYDAGTGKITGKYK
jgi:hypothetical protein